jgi:hypothetical protein
MKLNLLNMPYTQVRELVKYCVAHNIDRDRAERLEAVFTTSGSDQVIVDGDWALDIPESLITYFSLKWSNRQTIEWERV